jgi:hypothetical protein
MLIVYGEDTWRLSHVELVYSQSLGDPPAICNREAMKKSKIIALAKTMISTSFPSLRGMTLILEILDTEDFVMATRLEGKEILLDVSREDAARMGRSVGVLAHELCHAEEDYRHGPFLEALFSWLYERIPSLETRMERRIDLAVIRKGYGNDLLAFQRYHDLHYEPYDQTDGLTVKEIEEALKWVETKKASSLCAALSKRKGFLSSTLFREVLRISGSGGRR